MKIYLYNPELLSEKPIELDGSYVHLSGAYVDEDGTKRDTYGYTVEEVIDFPDGARMVLATDENASMEVYYTTAV